MIILKERGTYLDNKSGGDGITGGIIRLFSKDARNFNKGRYGEDIIPYSLNDLDDSHYLINDVTLPSAYGNIDHILLMPKGIFAIEAKHWEGEIICQGDDWKRRYHKGLFTTKDYPMGSPSRQIKRNAFDLSKLIESELFHNTFKVWVNGLLVFTNDNINLQLQEPTVTVLRVGELYSYITNYRQVHNLSKRDLESIGKFIIGISAR